MLHKQAKKTITSSMGVVSSIQIHFCGTPFFAV